MIHPIRTVPRRTGAAFAAALMTAGAVVAFSAPQTAEAQPRLLTPPLAADGQPFSFADLVERVSPAVVSIRTEMEVDAPQVSDPMRRFFEWRFGPDFDMEEGFGDRGGRPRRAQSQGSGFFIDKEGHVVTNNHVVEDADDISVLLADGRELKAELVGTDPGTDLAVLKVQADQDQPFVEFSTDTNLRVGDWVVAVGNPFGLGGTVTSGIVSAIGRDVNASNYLDFIQIDAPINRGNSGGPTFDLEGRVVGVNTAIFSPSGGSVGIGFAIPSSVATDVIDQLIEKGSVTRGWLGVSVQDVRPEIAAALGLKKAEGALIADVLDDGPAESAGFESGDVVLAIDGRPVTDARDLTQKIGAIEPGEDAKVKIYREDDYKTLTVRLGERDLETQIASAGGERGSSEEPDMMSEELGLRVEPVDEATRGRFRVPDDVKGVVVTGVASGGVAEEAGLAPGMVILQADNKDVKSAKDLRQRLEAAKSDGKEAVLLRFQLGDQRGFRALPLASK